MSKIKTKELIVCIITLIVLVLSIVTNVFAATSLNTLLDNSTGSGVQNIEERGNNTNNNTNNNTSNNKNNVLNKTNNTANNTNRTTTMPNTGVDYSILLIVAVCGISAIYAYKKISDYKNF